MAEDADLELPRGVALAWGVAADPQRGPKREMSVEKIVDAAVELADAEGLGAVSMAAVAARLGYTPMSLYRYVSAKDDLMLLMQEERDRPSARVGARGRGLARAARGDLPRAAGASTCGTRGCSTSRSPARPPLRTAPPGWMSTLDALRDTPLTEEERLAVTLLVTGHVRWYGTVLAGVRERRARRPGAPRADHRAARRRLFDALITAEEYPALRAGGRCRACSCRTPTRSRSGSSAILDGIAAYLDALAAGGHRPAAPRGPCSTTPTSPATRGTARRSKAVRDAEKALRDALQARAPGRARRPRASGAASGRLNGPVSQQSHGFTRVAPTP